MRSLSLSFVLALSLIVAPSAVSSSSNNYTQAKKAIYQVFGPYAAQALKVAGCETGGTYDINAQNGQYLGIFQMGDYARGRYGHGYTYLIQAVDAYEYFVASGKNWDPWTCKP